jgi:hypothetical protein
VQQCPVQRRRRRHLKFDFLLRFAPLAVGVVLSVMSWNSWTSGEPPPRSLFGPKSGDTVLESRVEEGRATNGSLRFTPIVIVTAPDGRQPLQGLIPSFSAFSHDMAASAVAAHPVGDTVSVRWVDGRPMADRIDLFSMAHAVGLSLFALVLLIGGSFWAMGAKPKANPQV